MPDNNKVIFEQLFNLDYNRLYVHALSWVNNEENAKDIVNDVFCYLWEHFEGYTDKNELLPLLYRLVRSRCIDHLRHLNAEDNYISYQLENEESESLSDEDAYDYKDYDERIARVMAEIKKLPTQTKRAFVEAVIHKKSYAEVAELLHIQPSTVKTLVSRAYKILRSNIQFLILFLYSL